MAQRKISKVVIPVAGMGTRFLPATKALPKELLPIMDKPIIHYIVEEAVAANIETVVFVTSRPKVAIEDYFDPGDLTAHRLAQVGKSNLIDRVLELSKKINIVSVRQYEALGLGHAVLLSEGVIGSDNFAVILGDEIIRNPKQSALHQCIETFATVDQGSVVGVMEVPTKDTSKYGIVEFKESSPTPLSHAPITKFFEKPQAGETPSRWSIGGRYVFESSIFSNLKQTRPGKNGEIQLTDAMRDYAQKNKFYARKLTGQRYDTGDRLGYLMANVAFALEEAEFKEDLRSWLKSTLL